MSETARVNTSDAGQFEIRLPAGDYVVQGQNLTQGPLPTALPVPVTVRHGSWTTVTIHFDSGVRGAVPS
jgi:hypothetical protein